MKSHCFFVTILCAMTGLLSACASGQVFGLTLTPTSTITNTPTATLTPTLTPFPTVTPTATESGKPGSSFATAIVIEANDQIDGITKEMEWFESHYPGYQQISQSEVINNKLFYDLVSILTVDGTQLTIYFDITTFHGKQ